MQTEELNYQHEEINLKAFVAYDETITTPRPGILIAHAWGGRDDFVCQKAKDLAEQGYVGFALDLYGEAKLGSNKEENTALMQPLIEDRTQLLRRMQAALSALRSVDSVDANRIAVMGYCFGGLCALDLARSGVDIKGAVSLHGLLSPSDLPQQTITAKILVLHGYADPMCPPEQVSSFADEMTASQADWQIHMYGNTLHAFTNPEANDPDFGTVYDAAADRRSTQAMLNFFAELF